MNSKRRFNLVALAGAGVGVALTLTLGFCSTPEAMPAEPEQPTRSAGAVINPTDWPYSTGETLVCGQDAKPAIDYREDVGWWAYCEPALVEQ